MSTQVACALIHYPVVDKEGRDITAAITNIDLHDISRSALTFGIGRFYVVHPVAAQRELAQRIQGHWVGGSGAKRIPDRSPALRNVRVVPLLQDAIDDWRSEHDRQVEVWTTSAKPVGAGFLTHDQARRRLADGGPPVVLCFGTAWGLAGSVHQQASQHLAPIESVRGDGYNHLSVRAAAAILFDRLLGKAQFATPQGSEV